MKALILALVLGMAAQLAAAACAEDRVTIRGDWGQATFTV